MSTVLFFTCTGEVYCNMFLPQALEGAKKFFPADILLFTDSPIHHDVAKQVYIEHKKYPGALLNRHRVLPMVQDWLAQYDHIFYLDVDMTIVKPIGDDILADGIIVTMHPDYWGIAGPTETNPLSTAYLPPNNQYVIGCFQGGSTKSFLEMSKVIAENEDIDSAHGISAVYYDESHLNRYVHDHPPAKILTTDYCCKWWKRNENSRIIDIAKDCNKLHQ